jgi:hypothetical protein
MNPVSSADPRYAVVTVDVVASRKVDAFLKARDFKLAKANSLHEAEGLILSPYTITAWDEFQAVLNSPVHIPRVVLDLRRIFYPLELWIAVGVGEASGVDKRPINIHAGGEAFLRAREAADQLKAGHAKFRVLTRFDTGNSTLDTIANAIYSLQDSLIEGTTAKQWATINQQLKTGSQEMTAEKLEVDISTVSRNLKRGHYWQLLETVRSMELILQEYL